MKKVKFMKIISIVLFFLGLLCPVTCCIKSVQFDQNCGGYLKQAADANTPELALERINVALDYIEANDLTDGYTSVLWKTEDENVGFWYRNIVACQDELKSCLNSSQLEKTNVLMKVRESLSDTPIGIELYPNNGLWAIAKFVSFLLIVTGFIGFLITRSN